MLETVELETAPHPTATIIWLHGLGADGHDFEPIVPDLARPGERALRFIFPHAPVRPVTLNGGMPMRAWYDIVGIDRSARQDEVGVRASHEAICALIRRENERGIASDRIVLAGFSQGGAMALFTGLRYPEKLAGLMGLSCYMVLAPTLDAERHPANQETPILMAHGSEDPVVDASLGEETCQMIHERKYPVQWLTYPMPHAVNPEEIAAIAQWLRTVLP